MQALALSEETQAAIAIDRLQTDIVSGVLEPGRKLRVAELKTLYGFGASPLREALSRVASLGYVTTESRRGFRVAELSRDDLTDITRSRQVIETAMLRESMQAACDEWELGIISSLERLRWAVRKSAAADIFPSELVDTAHKELHARLVGGCTAARLVAMQDLLFDQAYRYRQMMLSKGVSPQNFLVKHEELVEVVLGGDVERATFALADHLDLTLRDVYNVSTVPACPVCHDE